MLTFYEKAPSVYDNPKIEIYPAVEYPNLSERNPKYPAIANCIQVHNAPITRSRIGPHFIYPLALQRMTHTHNALYSSGTSRAVGATQSPRGTSGSGSSSAWSTPPSPGFCPSSRGPTARIASSRPCSWRLTLDLALVLSRYGNFNFNVNQDKSFF